jgi:hypothetical protein
MAKHGRKAEDFSGLRSRMIDPPDTYAAMIANAILAERGVRVYGTAEKLEIGAFEMHLKRHAWATHEAILLPPTPIAPADTAEQILRDLASVEWLGRTLELRERAQRLLDQLRQNEG